MVADRIRELRISRNWSQTYLAKQLQISNKRVSSWENKDSLPTVDMVIRLSRIFSVSTDYLLGVDDKRMLVVEGLTEGEIADIQAIISRFEANKQPH